MMKWPPRPRFRRIPLRALLPFLLLGAAVNVAVAWGLAYRAIEIFELHGSPPDLLTVGHQQRRIPVVQYPRWVAVALQEMDEPSVRISKEPAGESPGRLHAVTRERELIVHESGWPAMAMVVTRYQGLYDFYQPFGLGRHSEVSGTGVPFPTSGFRREFFGPEQLPLVPIWPGFAINTVFYAGVCWLLFAAPFAVRHRRRIKRGLCPACAYPVGASEVCTECGKPVKPRETATRTR